VQEDEDVTCRLFGPRVHLRSSAARGVDEMNASRGGDARSGVVFAAAVDNDDLVDSGDALECAERRGDARLFV
jgi:hypothetical protein